MKTCQECGERLGVSKFSPGRRVCKKCRAEAERERHAASRQAHLAELDDEEREAHERWRARRLAQHEELNARRRQGGLPELPEPYLEPDWLERMQARARQRQAEREAAT
jgi:hypothetical protein